MDGSTKFSTAEAAIAASYHQVNFLPNAEKWVPGWGSLNCSVATLTQDSQTRFIRQRGNGAHDALGAMDYAPSA